MTNDKINAYLAQSTQSENVDAENVEIVDTVDVMTDDTIVLSSNDLTSTFATPQFLIGLGARVGTSDDVYLYASWDKIMSSDFADKKVPLTDGLTIPLHLILEDAFNSIFGDDRWTRHVLTIRASGLVPKFIGFPSVSLHDGDPCFLAGNLTDKQNLSVAKITEGKEISINGNPLDLAYGVTADNTRYPLIQLNSKLRLSNLNVSYSVEFSAKNDGSYNQFKTAWNNGYVAVSSILSVSAKLAEMMKPLFISGLFPECGIVIEVTSLSDINTYHGETFTSCSRIASISKLPTNVTFVQKLSNETRQLSIGAVDSIRLNGNWSAFMTVSDDAIAASVTKDNPAYIHVTGRNSRNLDFVPEHYMLLSSDGKPYEMLRDLYAVQAETLAKQSARLLSGSVDSSTPNYDDRPF